MANIYVRSGAGGAATGADWANACLTLAAGITASAAGDDIYVAGDHAESTAGTTLTFKGTSASPNRVFCVNHAGSVPPVSADLLTTGVVGTAGVNAHIAINGVAYIRGIIFNAGAAANVANFLFNNALAGSLALENCLLRLNNTSGASVIRFGTISAGLVSSVRLINTPLQFGSVSQYVNPRACRLTWENTASAILGSIPNTLFSDESQTTVSSVYLHGVDLSAYSGVLCGTGVTGASVSVLFHDCKLHASASVGTPATYGGAEYTVLRSASSGIAYTQSKYNYAGAETSETTIIRTGGASVNGTPLSKKYITTANCKPSQPFQAVTLAVANSDLSSKTLNVYGIWGGGAVPTNADIWFEAFYLGDGASPQASVVSCGRADLLAAATSHAADSSTWGGSTTAFKMSVTLTPALAGEIYVNVKCGAASGTFYIDPAIELA